MFYGRSVGRLRRGRSQATPKEKRFTGEALKFDDVNAA